MAAIIGVRFKRGGKIYYFSPNEEQIDVGSFVVVETVRGTECGEVVMGRQEIDDDTLNREIKTIIRKATKEDLARVEDNKRKAKRAFDICNEKIKAHGLAMNLLEVEYTFDNSKIVFNFSAEGRVDFRELVKDLASVFRARIELRQIGVRDEAKMLGGLGVCGRPFCCKQFMGDFQSVSIKMAKEQGLSLNPVKISGTCGRLMCCLKHEQDTYEDLMRMLPAVGSTVVTPDGEGVVMERELVAGRVKVRLNGGGESAPKVYKMTELDDGSFTFSRNGAESYESSTGYSGFSDSYSDMSAIAALEEAERAEVSADASQEQRRTKNDRNDSRRDNSDDGPYNNYRRGRGQKSDRGGDGRRNGGKSNYRGGKNDRYDNNRGERYDSRRDGEEYRGKNSSPRGKYKGKSHPGKKYEGGAQGRNSEHKSDDSQG